MDARYIAAAIPLFFLAIGLELLVTRRRADPAYRFADSITNLSCGVGQQVLGVFLKAAMLAGYVWAYEHARIFTISPRSIVGWIALLFALDLCYYCFHRASHRINLIWAGHIVHHQSEEYNLSVALRQSWFVGAIAWVFYVPLAIAGFSPLMYVTMITLNTLYQFWIHTRSIGKLGPLEWVFNTPSHHRVHHGINPKYIDKNYAGIFIIWDRWLGTFQAEEDEPVYGTVKPLSSWNPLWANVEHFVTMARLGRSSGRLLDLLTVWFRPPEWLPAELGGVARIPEVARATQRRFEIPVRSTVRRYVLSNYVLVTLATTVFLLVQTSVSLPLLVAVGVAILITLVSLGALLEQRRWAIPLETLRLAGVLSMLVSLCRASERFVPLASVAALVTLLFGAWLWRLRAAGTLATTGLEAG